MRTYLLTYICKDEENNITIRTSTIEHRRSLKHEDVLQLQDDMAKKNNDKSALLINVSRLK